MALGGGRRLYEEDDVVDEYLLNQLSKWILYHRLGALARDLGITEAEFSRIAIATSQPEEQVFKVLYKWHNMNVMTVKDLVNNMVTWQQNKYLDPGVWSHFRSKINPDALPANISTLQLPNPQNTAHPLQLAFMEWENDVYSIKRRKVTIVEETVMCDRKADQQGESEPLESQSITESPLDENLPATSATSSIQGATSDEPPVDDMPLPLTVDKPPQVEGQSETSETELDSRTDHPASTEVQFSVPSDRPSADDESLDLTIKNLPNTKKPLSSQQFAPVDVFLPHQRPSSGPSTQGSAQAYETPSQLPLAHGSPQDHLPSPAHALPAHQSQPGIPPAHGLQEHPLAHPSWTIHQMSKVPKQELLSCSLLADYKRYNKESLRRRLKNFLSTDWLPHDKSKSFPLRGYYVNLDYLKKIKKAMKDKRIPMKSINDLFTQVGSEATSVHILMIGEAGSGKSSTIAMLALDWAEDKAPSQLQQFDFIFLVALRNIDSDIPLEEVVIKQHGRMKARKVPKEHIKCILDGSTESKVLLLLDGYDEYTKGTNTDIDEAITNTIGDCFIIVTSRPGDYMDKTDQEQMDGEIQIKGLSKESIREYATKYLGSETKCEDLLSKAKESGIDELLRIPIMLLMVCVLYFITEHLPTSKTEIVWKIIKMCIDRSTLKQLGKVSSEIGELDELLYILGELSWQALQRDRKQLLINKDEVRKRKPEILKLGLLHGSMDDEEATLEEEPEWLTYPHKLFQDFMGGYFLSKQTKEEIQKIFKCMDGACKFWESVKFAVGFSGEMSIFTEHILQLFVDSQIEFMKGNFTEFNMDSYCGDLSPLVEFAREMSSEASGLFCNTHISFVTSVLWQMRSKLYVFGPIRDYPSGFSESTGRSKTAGPEKCAIIIRYQPCIGVANTLKTISALNQPITNLYINEIEEESDDPVVIAKPVFTLDSEARNVAIDWPKMPTLEQKSLGNQISRCNCIEILEIPYLPIIAQAVAPELGNFHDLVYLDFSYCELSEEICCSICKHLRAMRKLEQLNLTGNPIGNNGTEVLVDSISSWESKSPLRKLELCNCEISSGLELLNALTYCHQLDELYLSMNPLAGSLKDLPSNAHFPDLSWFEITNTSLSGEDIQALATVIQNKGMPSLKHFEFGYDKLSDTKPNSTLPDDQPLERLNLKNEVIETLHALKYLLGDNGFSVMISGDSAYGSHGYSGDIFAKYVDSELQRRSLPVV